MRFFKISSVTTMNNCLFNVSSPGVKPRYLQNAISCVRLQTCQKHHVPETEKTYMNSHKLNLILLLLFLDFSVAYTGGIP